MIINDQLNKFIESINRNAPLCDNYFYPYKPALIIAMFTNLEHMDLFNKSINLNNEQILKTYYNLLTSDVFVFEKLSSLKSKEDWKLSIGYNEELKNGLLKNIFEMPAIKLKIKDSDFWSYDKNEQSIQINIGNNYSNSELKEIKEIILDHAYKTLKKCIPTYKDLPNVQINQFDQFVYNKLIQENLTEKDILLKQLKHTFDKRVKDRDKRCLICCENQPDLLLATCIKPTHDCENNIERYCCENGITLCANHNRLFNKKLFTFNNDWTVKISKKLQNSDYYLKMKEFEKCFSNIDQTKSSEVNKFLEYRNREYPV